MSVWIKIASKGRRGEGKVRLHQLLFLISVMLFGNFPAAIAQSSADAPISEASSNAKVVSVYGIEADDYLSAEKPAKAVTLKPKKYARYRVRWHIPDVFYYVGGPIFFILLIRIIAYFIAFFEEERREELKEGLREELEKESDEQPS